ncbi:uncharacterized protein [Haliotis cracherodii]|uniref:uncharacterized protein n=1 Tax=Haliotis cracherodii TaxID=6455 RepID=UPI0039E78164
MRQYIFGIVSIVVVTQSAFGATCPVGFYGPDCTRSCPPYCAEGRCELLSSGRSVNCTQGCQDGYRGLTCNTRCKRPCLTCDRYTGDCTGPCRSGFYGSRCLKRCLHLCLRCDKGSGRCLDPCENGFYGSNCSQRCSQSCHQCGKESGKCMGHCDDGFYGANCTKTCPAGCQRCDANTGDCVVINITTELQIRQTTTYDSNPDETSFTEDDDAVTVFPQFRYKANITTFNPYIMAIVIVVAFAGLLLLITTPFLICTCSRHRPGSHARPVKDVRIPRGEDNADHVYDEIGPPSVQPNTSARPDIETGYLTDIQQNTDNRYATPTQPNTETRYLTPTQPNIQTGYFTPTQPNIETRYLTPTQPNTETGHLTDYEAGYASASHPDSSTSC